MMKKSTGRLAANILATLFSLLPPLSSLRADTRDYAIELSAKVQSAPPSITLSWRALNNGTGYHVQRKSPDATQWGPSITLDPGATSYTDRNVRPGERYEYAVTQSPLPTYGGSGYIVAGVAAPLIDQQGTLILIVESSQAAPLAAELERLRQDLVGDGWKVLRHDVARTDSPSRVKALIQADHHADSAVRAVFLFGHVPVPYSGDFNPDYHPDHRGAWPADVYYGELDGEWTDQYVNDTGAARDANHNVPGDGKFDQTDIPSPVELEVGRVDLSNLPSFAPKTETDLLRQYLTKDHRFRHGQMNLPRRGLIADNFGVSEGEAFAASAWRNFTPFFGPDHTDSVTGWQYFNTLAQSSYLWSYACGGGAYDSCYYVGGTGDFALSDPHAVFNMLLGSYFGDWDAPNDFLRAPLASPSFGLASVWSGRPHWFLHPMALGATIGACARMTQNNGPNGLYHPSIYEGGRVHIALMGDPTLKMFPVRPPTGLQVQRDATGAHLAWSPSPDENIVGYHVYRAASENGTYIRLTGDTPILNLAYTDLLAPDGAAYMIRAVKLEESGSGTFLNPSQGAFSQSIPDAEPAVPMSTAGDLAQGNFAFAFGTVPGQRYQIESSSDLQHWTPLDTIVADGLIRIYQDTGAGSQVRRFYRAVLVK